MKRWCIPRSKCREGGLSVKRKILNASNLLGTIAILDISIAIPGTVDENPVLTMALIAAFALCVYLAMKEDGKIR